MVETRAACSPIRLASHALASEAPDRASALLETLGEVQARVGDFESAVPLLVRAVEVRRATGGCPRHT